jgi:hypothetical protein
MYGCVVKYMLTDVSEAHIVSIIALIMEAVRTSETSVNIYLPTRQYIPEYSKLHAVPCFRNVEVPQSGITRIHNSLLPVFLTDTEEAIQV